MVTAMGELFAGYEWVPWATATGRWFAKSDAAAWIQAVGSVAAIVVAIIVDQGAARRARSDRFAHARQMRHDRVLAISNCIDALEHIEEGLAGATWKGQPLQIGGWSLRRLEVANKAIDYYVTNAGEVGPDLMGALAHVQTVVADARETLTRRDGAFYTVDELEAAREAMRARVADLRDVRGSLRR